MKLSSFFLGDSTSFAWGAGVGAGLGAGAELGTGPELGAGADPFSTYAFRML